MSVYRFYKYIPGDTNAYPGIASDGLERIVIKFHKLDDESKSRIFEQMLEVYNWPRNIEILAIPDNSKLPTFSYSPSAFQQLIHERDVTSSKGEVDVYEKEPAPMPIPRKKYPPVEPPTFPTQRVPGQYMQY